MGTESSKITNKSPPSEARKRTKHYDALGNEVTPAGTRFKDVSKLKEAMAGLDEEERRREEQRRESLLENAHAG